MATINHLEGYAFAKKKGDTIHVFEGPHTLSDYLPVIAEGTDVPRILKDRFADVVNVKDFGAKGDGVTDDTTSFTQALLLCTANRKNLYVPWGTYLISNVLPSPMVMWFGDQAELIFSNFEGKNGISFNGENPDGRFVGLDGFILTSKTSNGETCIETPKGTSLYYGNSVRYIFTNLYCRGSERNESGYSFCWKTGFKTWIHVGDCVGAEISNVCIQGTFDIKSNPVGQTEDCGILLDANGGILTARISDISIGPIHTAIKVGSCAFYSINCFDFIGTYNGIYQDENAAKIFGEPKIFEGNINAQNVGIYLKDSVSRTITSVTIRRHSSGWKGAANDWSGIKADNCSDLCISRCTIQPDESSGEFSGTSHAIYTTGCGGLKVLGNNIGTSNDKGVSLNNCNNYIIADTISWQNKSTDVLFDLTNNTRNGVIVAYSLVSSFIGKDIEKDETIVNPNSIINQNIELQSARNVQIDLTKTTASEDQKTWRVVSSNNSLARQTVNDSGLGSNFEIITREGTVVSQIEWRASNFKLDGTLNTRMTVPVADATYSLGSSALRYTQLYAATGTINTSDQRVKSSVASASDTLLDAVGNVPIHTFQFTDAVEKKGAAAARFHAGVVAQEVASAFQAQGLDAARYGLFCHDQWSDTYEDVRIIDQEEEADEDGTIVKPLISHVERKKVLSAGDRYGIRYEELLVLECARLRRELGRIQAALVEHGITL
jgi:hypothetical protein